MTQSPPPHRDPQPTPIDREAQTLAAPGSLIEGAGAMIGPYKLLQKLGEGGMGQVWVADQEHPVKRRVALKVIKAGMDTEQVIARFEAERQALAMMDHTNIARVLDAGQTNSGRPYFVMELVKGVPITKYCDELHLTLRDRLKLFIPVCQAIQHAHQKGIIHRDIKPGNVLVCMQDGQPVPKVIDFGLAKALGQKLSQHTMVTQFGAVVGTLEYMSPEQAELSALDIDTRADVYALGVMLYELLVGTTPLTAQRLKQTAFDEVLRCIREVDPPRPSTRLSESKDTIISVAALRKTEPMRLTRDLKGDLDWIVMKCLEKDRTRRYDAAAALARDVERFLTDEPIEARPPSMVYQTQKFVRKNRIGISIAASFLVLLLGATALSTWQAYRATKAEVTAKENEKKAIESEKRAIQQQKLAEANEEKAKSAAIAADRAKENETASLKKQIEFAQSELSSRRQAYALADALETLFDPDNNDRESTDIIPRLKKNVAQIVETVDKAENADPMLRGRLRQSLGKALMGFQDYDRAIQEFTKAVQINESNSGPESPQTLIARSQLGLALIDAGRMAEAKQTLEEVYAIHLRVQGPDHDDTLGSLHDVAWQLQKDGHPEEALKKFQEIADRLRKLKGPESDELARTLVAQSKCSRESGAVLKAIEFGEEAFRIREKLHGPEDWRTLQAKYHLAWANGDAGKADPAIKLYEELLTVKLKLNGPNHVNTIEAIGDLAWAYGVKGDYTSAIARYEEALKKRREVKGFDDAKSLETQSNLGQTYNLAGMSEKALPLYADLCERIRLKYGPDNVNTWNAENDYAYTCDLAKQPELAGKLYEGVLASKRKQLTANDPRITTSINNLGNHYFDTKQYDKALALYEEAYARNESQFGPNHRETIVVLTNYGKSLSRLDRHDEAIEKLKEALKRQQALGGLIHAQTLYCMTSLADAYQAKPDLANSLKLNEQAAQGYSERFGPASKDALARLRIVRWQRASLGDKSGALEVALKIHQQDVKSLGERDPVTMMDLSYIADLYESLGNPELAEPLRRQSLEFAATQPTAPFMTPIIKSILAKNLIQQKKYDDAKTLLDEVMEYYRKNLPGNINQHVNAILLAKCHQEATNYENAEKLLLEAADGLEKAQSPEAITAMRQLTELYLAWKKPEKAEEWRKKSVTSPLQPSTPLDGIQKKSASS